MTAVKENTQFHEELRESVRNVCSKYPDAYWRELDAKSAYPEEFVNEITRHGFLAALIPEEYGGSGLGITEASIILEEINRSGGNAGACHAQMYTMGTLLRHGSPEQKKKYLPKIADGSLRLQAFGVTEPNTGTDTTKLRTFAERRGDKYIVNGLDEILVRTEIDKSDVDEIIIGQAKQSTDAPNLARLALLRAGFPIEVPGYTVHRQCGSGVQAMNNGAQQIMCGLSDIIIAGGAESMSTAPYYLRNARFGFRAGNAEILDSNTESQPRAQPIETYGHLTMGMTAENLAELYSISRTEQDEFALRSQENAQRAISNGLFTDQIVPFEVKTKKGSIEFKVDEHPRETSMEKLAQLPPVFKENGTVTAGNTSGRNDGAGVVLLMSEEAAERYGKKQKQKLFLKLSQVFHRKSWELVLPQQHARL